MGGRECEVKQKWPHGPDGACDTGAATLIGSGRFEQGDGIGTVLQEMVLTLISQGGARPRSGTRVSQQVNQSEHGKERV